MDPQKLLVLAKALGNTCVIPATALDLSMFCLICRLLLSLLMTSHGSVDSSSNLGLINFYWGSNLIHTFVNLSIIIYKIERQLFLLRFKFFYMKLI